MAPAVDAVTGAPGCLCQVEGAGLRGRGGQYRDIAPRAQPAWQRPPPCSMRLRLISAGRWQKLACRRYLMDANP